MPQHRFLCRDALERPGASRLRRPGPDDGAYLLFTSGSTGAPKGVPLRHANVMAYLRATTARYQPTPDDRFTQLFDLTFDLSVHDMFLCWGAGAALYCPSDAARMAPQEFVRRHDLTFWFSVPSTATYMQRLRILRPGLFPSLRWSLFCGEALPRRIAEAWAAAAPNSTVENLYGPTEATIAITAYRLPADPDAAAQLPDIVPIGRPFPGQAAIVIDAEGTPAPMGEAGKLCLGGSQVAEGYWRRPDLTAERFLPPQGTDPGMGWYRTGDRVRETAEHGLVFLGRMDRQVKINGHRVELQEVEAALGRAAASDCVAALAWPLDAGGLARGIVAFVGRDDMPAEAILEACRRMLPPYMVPSQIRPLSDWPVNDHGKADYKRLRQLLE
ncbi:AMP-binding protein [Dankookia sp. P2]|uniref:AMP-binding protein n=1 Tax=Dankookia sp. P2 TaxID=3423955 RepID=UPI003D66ECB2